MAQISYKGPAHIPGIEEGVDLTAIIDNSSNTVTIEFERELAGSSTWQGNSVEINERLKYSEIVFKTANLPLDTINLVWKFNASKIDDNLAAVIVPQPNKLRVSGEKGFVLTK